MSRNDGLAATAETAAAELLFEFLSLLLLVLDDDTEEEGADDEEYFFLRTEVGRMLLPPMPLVRVVMVEGEVEVECSWIFVFCFWVLGVGLFVVGGRGAVRRGGNTPFYLSKPKARTKAQRNSNTEQHAKQERDLTMTMDAAGALDIYQERYEEL